MEGDLRVLKKGSTVVDAATGSVEERLGVVVPGAPNHHLLPRLVDAQVWRVDETAQDQVREVGNKVVKCHPAEKKGRVN